MDNNTQVPARKQSVYYQFETTNQSFIQMHYILKEMGIKNNKFFLVLYDKGLASIDPRDPNLPLSWQARVLREVMINYWYFIREIVRIPDQGGTVGGGARYKLHRGNLAMNYLFIMNYNQFVELPRQHYKTKSALCWFLWVFNFGSTNSEMMFMHKNHQGSKDNLRDLKAIRDALPSYLRMDGAITTDGKKLKIPNTVEVLGNPANYNKIRTLASAKNKAAANNMGRGATMPIHYYDEFAFMPYNKIVYGAATPAYKTASMNAKRNGSPYGILVTTTPGDLTTSEGLYAFDMRNNATPWKEDYYDLDYQQLEELHNSNSKSSFFLISYTYQQLGSTEEYFRSMVIDLNNDWANIRREVLLEWATIAGNCPFKQEDLEVIESHLLQPIRTLYFGKAKQYQLQIFMDYDTRYPPIIGVDVATGRYKDSSAITIIDSKTTQVIAAFNCNYISQDDLAVMVYTIVKQFMPNAIVNIESNGGFGAAVLEILVKTDIKANLYYEIKERVLEERSNGFSMGKSKQTVKVFGLNTNPAIRNRLIEILYERVEHHKDKFSTIALLNEMKQMEVKKNGKVEHSDLSHDDQVFSYLMAMYVWYDGKDLMQNFGIKKMTIETDDMIDEVVDEFKIDEKSNVDINAITENITEEQTEEAQLTKQFFSMKAMSYEAFQTQIEEQDRACLEELLRNNPEARELYAKMYHIDIDEGYGMFDTRQDITRSTIPDSVFTGFNDDFIDDDEDQEYSIYQGSLGDQFKNL